MASYAERLGLAPKNQPTRKFSMMFWDNLTKTGHVNETTLGIRLYFMNGFVTGIKTALKAAPLGFNMLKTGRFNPFALLFHSGCKGKNDIHKILKKARELENARMQKINQRGALFHHTVCTGVKSKESSQWQRSSTRSIPVARPKRKPRRPTT